MTKRHVPPSRLRYEATHPIVGARVGLDLYKMLTDDATKTSRSVAEIIRDELYNNYAKGEFDEGEPQEDSEVEAPESNSEQEQRIQELSEVVLELTIERDGLVQEVEHVSNLEYKFAAAISQISDLKKRAAEGDRWQAKAKSQKAQLEEIAGPFGMFLHCFRCGKHWKQPRWNGAFIHSGWMCR